MVRALAYSPDTQWWRRWRTGATTSTPASRTGSSAENGICSYTSVTRLRNGSNGRLCRGAWTRYSRSGIGLSNVIRATKPSIGRTPPRSTRWPTRSSLSGTRRPNKASSSRAARYWRASANCSSSGNSGPRRPSAVTRTFAGRPSAGGSFSGWTFSRYGSGTRGFRRGRRCRSACGSLADFLSAGSFSCCRSRGFRGSAQGTGVGGTCAGASRRNAGSRRSTSAATGTGSATGRKIGGRARGPCTN